MPKDKDQDQLQEQKEVVQEGLLQKERPQTISAEQAYPRAELIANSQVIFGVMPEVLAGALHGNNAQELTISEVKKAVNEFLKRRVS